MSRSRHAGSLNNPRCATAAMRPGSSVLSSPNAGRANVSGRTTRTAATSRSHAVRRRKPTARNDCTLNRARAINRCSTSSPSANDRICRRSRLKYATIRSAAYSSLEKGTLPNPRPVSPLGLTASFLTPPLVTTRLSAASINADNARGKRNLPPASSFLARKTPCNRALTSNCSRTRASSPRLTLPVSIPARRLLRMLNTDLSLPSRM